MINRGVANSKKFLQEIQSALTINPVRKRRNDLQAIPNIEKFVTLDGDEKYSCNVCNRTFANKSNIRYHIACGDSAESYSCCYCDKLFKSSSHLKYHTRTVHTLDLPYKCNKCPKSFAQLGKLKRHQLIHTGERPFSCEICRKSFQTKYQLQEHKNIHSEDDHHPCLECGRKFADKNNLRRHINSFHKPCLLKCSICGKVCHSKYEFEQHSMKHNLDSGNTCGECGKGFKNKRVLDRHKLTHLSSKNFSCSDCGKTFSRRDHLKRHYQKLHALLQLQPEREDEDVDGNLEELIVDEEPIPEASSELPKKTKNPLIVGSINQLPADIYNNDDINSVRSILKNFTSDQIHEVVEVMEPGQIKTLKSILSQAEIQSSLQPPKINVKKSLLKRYRNQSGIGTSQDEFDEGSFPKISLSSQQREAATRALATWIDEHRDERMDAPVQSPETSPTPGHGHFQEKTVIKMTPFGPRKITIYDGEMQDES